MASRRTPIRHILIPVMVFLVLSGIVVAEFPEILRLTEDTTNDYTIRRTNTLVLPAFLDAKKSAGLAEVDSAAASNSPLSRPSSLDNAALVPSKLFLLHSDLRR
jgi:hypothetical protein